MLSNQWRAQITTPHVSTEFAGLPLHYGYGIYVDDGFMYNDQWYAEKVWQHGGNTSSYTHLFWILPEKNIAVSVMSSGGYTNFDASMVAALNSVTELPSPAEIPVVAPNPDEYAKHEGIYDTGQFTIIVEQQNDELHITIPELDAQNAPYEQAMAAIGDGTFFTEINNELLQITFLPVIEGGESVYMRHRNLVGIKDGY
ncbi:serine hydrolase [Paraglaciecola aquimarina]|uniref:Serine hydrolase n=1 Tax=Paraglaciecola aquimarina TaxID=1235557 RepID=A0ABU3T1V7_9ALTE|nr:serine hydrolase [Paraglaciecola aquimarina]MDU0356210.1 serine hydrolase [Paraglaciecola aquimarina]